MDSYERFSKRISRAERTGTPVTYLYDVLPDRFRTQVLHILIGTTGESPDSWRVIDGMPLAVTLWSAIREEALEEFGVFELTPHELWGYLDCKYFLEVAPTNDALDFVELAFRYLEREEFAFTRPLGSDLPSYPKYSIVEAVKQLNRRFKEHDLGYRYQRGNSAEPGMLIKADSEYFQSDVVEPALLALHSVRFLGAHEEFAAAQKHYRRSENKQAISEAAKAFESCMKAICAEQGWELPSNPTANPLVQIVFEKGLVPPYLDTHLSALRTLLGSGVPTMANRNGRHGQGTQQVEVPDHVAAYVLHMTAANILFLVDCHNALMLSHPSSDPTRSEIMDDVPF